MFRLNLVLRTQDEDTLLLVLPGRFRIMFAVIAAITIASMITIGEISTFPAVIAVVCLAVCLYEERWVFDRQNGIVRHRVGLLVAAKNSSFALDAIEEFRLVGYRSEPDGGSSFMRRRVAMGSLVVFALGTSDGKQHTIELRKNRYNRELLENAQAVATHCGKPLDEGR